jgi:branched-chain amino acid transport system permease protein
MAEIASQPTFNWRPFVRLGLLGGVVALYVSAIGMVETFSGRNLIGGFLNLGYVLLFAGALMAGYLTSKETHAADNRLTLAAAGLAGVFAGLPNVVLIIVASSINMRMMFINISQGLVNILTFDQGVVLGSLIFILISVGISLIGAILYVLPPRIERPLVYGLAVSLMVGLFAETIGQVIQRMLGREVARLIFQGGALRPIAALVIFLITAGLIHFRATRRQQIQRRYDALSTSQRKYYRWTMLALGIILIAILPQIVGPFLSQVLFMVGLYILMGLGLNIVVGFAGLLDLGYVAFFAFGAYTMGLLTSTTDLGIGAGFNFWLALPVSVIVAVFFGILLGFPVLRMRGDYLAITTLGFGEIIRILALSDWLKPYIGGAQGILRISPPKIGGLTFDSPQMMYYVVLFGGVLAAFIAVRLRDARLGRQWMAMREDEDVAEAMGINLISTKLLAFAIGAGFSGLSGAIFAARVGTIFPHSFNLLISINVLALIIVGGLGSIPGVVIGALILVGMPELLREFAEYRLLMYGILLIVMMLTRPEGFLPAETIRREFHVDEVLEQAAVTDAVE